jgi:light-regulated signal transduction histidine kinase (bacteriophytochrome)
METLRESLEGDRFVLLQAFCLRKDASLLPVEVSVSRFTLAGEDRFCFLIRDITERRHAEAQLHRTMIELEHSNTELEQFAYVVSHDLQEPLRKITAFGDLLQTEHSESLNEEGRDYVGRMQHAAVRMADLIRSLLRLSRVTTGAHAFDRVDLNEVLAEVLVDLEGRLVSSQGSVEQGALPIIEAEDVQMRQLFQNLVGNALKYGKPDVAPLVHVYAEAVTVAPDGMAVDFAPADLCRIIVQDNGIGFEEGDTERIFGIFQRLHTRDKYEGTGIGLSICRKIVERHGGDIVAEAVPGEGARFIMTLPVSRPPVAEVPEAG